MDLYALKLFLKKIGVTMASAPVPPTELVANHTLTAADNGKTFANNSGTPRVVTVPRNLPDGFGATFIQGDGAQTVELVSGDEIYVTLFVLGDKLTKTAGPNSVMVLRTQYAGGGYVVSGDLAAPPEV